MSSFVYRDGMWETIREHVPFPDVVVEVGSRYGHWPCQLFENVHVPRRIFCVDTWVGFHRHASSWVERLGPRAFDVAFPLYGTSEQWSRVWRGDIDLLYIDGQHTKQAVAVDLDGWFRFVRPGGLCMVHDAHMDGVREAVEEFFERRPEEPRYESWGPRKRGFDIQTAWVVKV